MNIGYARVSTNGQDLESQVQQLQAHNVELDNIYQEKVTGTSIAQRTQLEAMIKNTRAGDTVYITKIDRLARSIIDLNKIVGAFNDKEVSVYFTQDNLYFEAGNSSPMNDLIFNMLGSFAQFERDLIVQRTSEGRERAKKQGKHLGRPSQPKDKIKRAVSLFNDRENNSLSVNDIVDMTGVPRATIYREAKKV